MNFFIEKFLFRSKFCCTVSVNENPLVPHQSTSSTNLSPVITTKRPTGANRPTRTSDNDSCLSSTISTLSSTTNSSGLDEEEPNQNSEKKSNLPQNGTTTIAPIPPETDRSLYACCVRCFNFKQYYRNSNTKPERETIKLLLLGLDNAGKTSVALRLSGESVDDIVPTIGFSNFAIKAPTKTIGRRFRIVLYDLGGGRRIRTIWPNYYSLVHGVLFVIDSANIERILEVKQTLEDVISNEKIAGKPILIYLNKQDLFEAMDEIDILKFTNIEELITKHHCLAKIKPITAIHNVQDGIKTTTDSMSPTPQSTTDESTVPVAKSQNSNNNIESSFQWLVEYVAENWDELNRRVIEDSTKQIDGENSTMRNRIEKYNQIRAASGNIETENDNQQSQKTVQNGSALSIRSRLSTPDNSKTREDSPDRKSTTIVNDIEENEEELEKVDVYEEVDKSVIEDTNKADEEEEIDQKLSENKLQQIVPDNTMINEQINDEAEQCQINTDQEKSYEETTTTTTTIATIEDSSTCTVEIDPPVKPKQPTRTTKIKVKPRPPFGSSGLNRPSHKLNAINDRRTIATAKRTNNNKNRIHPT